jgi:phosphoglycerate dehydrogenase-like enzyme
MAIPAVAEFTLALILAWHRPVMALAAGAEASAWGLSPGRELRGRTLGVVGLGAIGAEVARQALALGMDVAAWSPSLTPERAQAHGIRARALPALLADADVVSLHLRLGPRTERLVGRDFLRQMKRTALLVNTSRAGLVDEDALWEALSEARLAGAALDVHGQEPLPEDSRWFRLRNALLTPHCAWATHETLRRMAERAVANALAFFAAGGD